MTLDFKDLGEFDDLNTQTTEVEAEFEENSKNKVIVVNFKLPKLELSFIDSDIKNRMIFKESFERTVYSNTHIPAKQKVRYLIERLTGRVKQMIINILPYGDNYELIWKKLKDKYNDENVLAKFYFNEKNIILKYFFFKAGQFESVNFLENFLERFVSANEGLKIFKTINVADFLVLELALTKLDDETSTNFEMYMRFSENPTFDELIEFVQQQVKILGQPRKLFNKTPTKIFTKNQTFLINKTNIKR